MKINKAFKYRIYPNSEQQEILAKHFGCTRFVYNFFLRQRIDYYVENKDNQKKGLTFHDTALRLTQLKKKAEFEWLRDVNSQSLQGALRDLDIAYNNFFNKRAKFPKFKKKHRKQSFTVPQHWSIQGNTLNIPKCTGLKIVLHRETEGTPKSVTISMTPSGKYFASILCEVDMPEPTHTGGEIGIDFGVKSFIVTSDAEVIEPPKFLRKSERQLKRLQKRVSKKQKGSNSRRKAIHRLAVKHEKVSNQRSDFLHKLSRELVGENQAIHIESLAIRNMVKNHCLAKSITDAGWSAFVNMLEYKGKWYGCHIHKADRFFPSSKRCHICGFINENLTLKDREWECPECNAIHNRDLNAAINILNFSRVGTTQTQAGGDGRQQASPVKPEAPSERAG